MANRQQQLNFLLFLVRKLIFNVIIWELLKA